MVQSNYAFRWRIQVLNRDAAIDAGGKDKYANWMSLLPDTRLLSAINIPGTHDSGTANVEGSWNSSSNVVACQKYFIEQQLYAGVRSLDIRTQWHSGTNAMVLTHNGYICHTPNHGSSKNKTFASVLDTLIAFLQKHPKEAIVHHPQDRQRRCRQGHNGAAERAEYVPERHGKIQVFLQLGQ